jgi:hypothetical protein
MTPPKNGLQKQFVRQFPALIGKRMAQNRRRKILAVRGGTQQEDFARIVH